MKVKKVSVFCSSSEPSDPEFNDQAYQLGKLLALSGREIIYGGGKAGLMGKLAEGVLDHQGFLTGVIPDFMKDKELANLSASRLITVSSMHERENYLMRSPDCIIALPGSVGTYSELMQSLAWKLLGIINPEIIIINFKNYFDPILASLDNAVSYDLMNESDRSMFRTAEDAESAFYLIDNSLTFSYQSSFYA